MTAAQQLTADKARIQRCLDYINAPHTPLTIAETRWFAEVRSEARALGLLPPLRESLGAHCRPGIDRGIVYGGDMLDVF